MQLSKRSHQLALQFKSCKITDENTEKDAEGEREKEREKGRDRERARDSGRAACKRKRRQEAQKNLLAR